MRRAALVALLLLFGCEESPPLSLAPPPAGNPGPIPSRVLVVNALSWTLSSLDLETRVLSPRAADLGAAANRVTRSPDGGGLLVAASGDNEVSILSERDFSERLRIDVGRGSNPWIAVPVSPTAAVVTNWLSSDVRMISLDRGDAGPPLATDPGPEGVAVLGRRAFVACTNWLSDGSFGTGRLDVVDLDAWRVVATVDVGANPQDVLIDGSGQVHVLCTGNYGNGPAPEAGSVHVVDPAALQVTGIVPLGGSPGRLAAGDGDVVWVAGFAGGLRRYDAATLMVLPDPTEPALASQGLSAVAWDAETGKAYVASFDADLLLEVDGSTLSVTYAWTVGDGPVDVLVFRDR